MKRAPFRMQSRLAAVLVALCLGLPPAAAAEDKLPAGDLVAPGSLLIDGAPVSCGPTPALISDAYPDYGAARDGLIILNPVRLKALPGAARLLIYYHECAHQVIGRSELAADCWAVQTARREGLLTRAGLRDACGFIGELSGNEHHPPGALRCSHMARCFDETYRLQAETRGPLDDVARAAGVGVSSGFSMMPDAKTSRAGSAATRSSSSPR